MVPVSEASVNPVKPADEDPEDVLFRATGADPVPGAFDPTTAVLFPHIPRTGGSTLKHLLAAVFGSARTRLDVHRYQTLSRTSLERAAVVEGHKSATYFDRSARGSWPGNGVTIVREPVSRVVSQARHIRARPDADTVPRQLRRPLPPLDEVFDAVPLLCNLQTRLLATGLPAPVEATREHLDAAKRTLEQMAFGVTDAFDTSMAMIAERFGLLLPPFGKTNASPPRGDDDLRSDEFRAEAERRNDLDIELYAFARELFDARIEAYARHLLDLPLDEGPLECGVEGGGRPIAEGVLVHRTRGRLALKGWLLVGGHAADAVLVRVGDQVVPLAAGIETPKLGRRNRRWSNLHAGVQGTVDLPPDASSLEVIAIDRRHGRRATGTFEIVRQARRRVVGDQVARGVRRQVRRARRLRQRWR